MRPNRIKISVWLWMRLILQLRGRGLGRRESGAFLLGKVGSSRITRIICYDDLDPEAFESGIIVFRGFGFVPLWEHCRREGMMVLADVHTHPDAWTGQSDSDRSHPMVGQKGHIAMIVPYYAQRNLTNLRGIGIYEYAGDHRWHDRPRGKFELTFL